MGFYSNRKVLNKAFGRCFYEEKSTCNYVGCRINNADFGVRKKEKLYEIPDLSQYKTDYVGDSSNVINIVSGQEYPEGYSYDSILHVDLAPVKELVSLQRRCANNLN